MGGWEKPQLTFKPLCCDRDVFEGGVKSHCKGERCQNSCMKPLSRMRCADCFATKMGGGYRLLDGRETLFFSEACEHHQTKALRLVTPCIGSIHATSAIETCAPRAVRPRSLLQKRAAH